MNVQEVEERTGLTRANIRFYEKQGLLKPSRKENGYRDYSAGDVDELQKIRLLRELDIPIEEIARLQRDEEALTAALEKREAAIGEEQENLLDSKKVCQSMRAEREDFAGLKAVKYLEELERLAKERGAEHAGEFKRKQDVFRETLHPWRRFFARMLDESIYSIAVMLVYYQVFHGKDNLAWIICGTLLVMAMTVLVEATLLSGFGTTVGKWLFGIRVLSENGKRLSWQEAAERTGAVLWRGDGLCIPVWNIYCAYKCYDVYTEGEILPWDEKCLYLIEEKKGVRYSAAIAAVCALFVMEYIFEFPSEAIYKLPVNYGSLTVEEFAENYNEYLKLYDLADKERLSKDGKWEQPGALLPEFQYELEPGTLEEKSGKDKTEGIIKKISFEIDYTGNESNPDYIDEVACALLAWEGTRHSTPWGLLFSQDIPEIEAAANEWKEEIHNGYKGPGKVSHEIMEMYGYQCVEGGLFPQSDAQEGSVHIVFEMEK